MNAIRTLLNGAGRSRYRGHVPLSAPGSATKMTLTMEAPAPSS